MILIKSRNFYNTNLNLYNKFKSIDIVSDIQKNNNFIKASREITNRIQKGNFPKTPRRDSSTFPEEKYIKCFKLKEGDKVENDFIPNYMIKQMNIN